jgi:CheY-like chemotaxis protein
MTIRGVGLDAIAGPTSVRTIIGRMEDGNGPLVLVVDDDSRSRELLRIVLKHAGYRVISAPDAQAAVAMLQAERPVAALADLMMPGMTGIEFCRWTRTRPELAGLRFILLTGMDADETRAEAREAGVDAMITKPFDRVQLLATLAGLIAG